jgi:hypothetical protein
MSPKLPNVTCSMVAENACALHAQKQVLCGYSHV